LTATQSIDIDVLPVNDPPVIDIDADDSSGSTGLDYDVVYQAGSAPLLITGNDAVLADIDSQDLVSVTVEITNISDGAQELRYL